MRNHARVRRNRGSDTDETRQLPPPATDDRPHPDDEPHPDAQRARIARVEERLTADVEQVEAGSVRIRRRTVEEPETVQVELRHDELHLERIRVDRPLEAGESPVTDRGDTMVVLVIEERLEVRRVPWVVEEVHVQRALVTDRQSVTDTVRRQHIEIEPQGDVELTKADT
jgi:uncharacterized protein (TIGR02271 family)